MTVIWISAFLYLRKPSLKMILDSHVKTKVSSELSANVDKNHPGLVNCTMKPCVLKMHLSRHQFGSFYKSIIYRKMVLSRVLNGCTAKAHSVPLPSTRPCEWRYSNKIIKRLKVTLIYSNQQNKIIMLNQHCENKSLAVYKNSASTAKAKLALAPWVTTINKDKSQLLCRPKNHRKFSLVEFLQTTMS